MVMSAERGLEPPDPVAAGDARDRILRSSSSPVLKTWGRKIVFRCLNVNGRGEVIGSKGGSVGLGCRGSDARRRRVRDRDEEKGGDEEVEARLMMKGERRMRVVEVEKEEEGDGEGEGDDGALQVVRAKVMVNLSEAADRVQLVVGSGPRDREREAEAERKTEPAPSSASGDATRPWNLRARSAVRRVVRYGFEPDAMAENGGPARPGRPRSCDAAMGERPKFSISLLTKEIAEDIYAITGSLPRRRPKKRARVVQKELDALFPGSWLTEITADLYNVPD